MRSIDVVNRVAVRRMQLRLVGVRMRVVVVIVGIVDLVMMMMVVVVVRRWNDWRRRRRLLVLRVLRVRRRHELWMIDDGSHEVGLDATDDGWNNFVNEEGVLDDFRFLWFFLMTYKKSVSRKTKLAIQMIFLLQKQIDFVAHRQRLFCPV